MKYLRLIAARVTRLCSLVFTNVVLQWSTYINKRNIFGIIRTNSDDNSGFTTNVHHCIKDHVYNLVKYWLVLNFIVWIHWKQLQSYHNEKRLTPLIWYNNNCFCSISTGSVSSVTVRPNVAKHNPYGEVILMSMCQGNLDLLLCMITV